MKFIFLKADIFHSLKTDKVYKRITVFDPQNNVSASLLVSEKVYNEYKDYDLGDFVDVTFVYDYEHKLYKPSIVEPSSIKVS